ncbi:uncharacterized protein HD556DRAFT_1451522 [Suillus plorans]|uniref:CCHC-type domain-containing protein n=1 Tax=Suillus plorans TaxID=116603 RepID=A0A9P7A930_9AGAM|nr:uncharacterized protein HD556DRAFT_1451522 [Suillus plorans]KAG1784673.1 hypothetical protein HD556DRAFT_1451522 [Suillus plorans]
MAPKKATKKKLPERGTDGRFLASDKSLNSSTTASSLATSANSSPLDTPEVVNRSLPDTTSDNGEYKADLEDNQEKDDDLDSLPGAPNPEAIIWPTEDIPSPPFNPTEQTQKFSRKTPLPASLPTALTPVKPLTIRLPILPITPPNSQLTVQTSAQSPTSRRMSSNSTPGWFHSKPDENAQNFLREVDRYIVLSDLKTEAAKVIVFSTLLSAGSVADLWWTKLDSSKKTTWADVQSAFTSRWLAITIAEKTGLDYQQEILALRINEEELGMQVTVAGVPTWAHLRFHAQIQQLVNEAGTSETAGLVYQVRENMPMVIKDFTTPGLADWTKFLDEIKAIDTNKLWEKAEAVRKKREVEKAQNTRLARLEGLQTDAIEVLRLQLQRTNLGTTQSGITASNTTPYSSNNTMSRICDVPRTSTARPPVRQRQPLSPEEKEMLRSGVNDIPHQPDTAAGITTYEEQLKQWFAKYGQDGRVNESTQFPLCPGSAMICSGECFKCGSHGHIAGACPAPEASQLVIQEKIWRSIAARELGNFNQGHATQIDLMFEEEYAQRWEQGKGQGSSV